MYKQQAWSTLSKITLLLTILFLLGLLVSQVGGMAFAQGQKPTWEQIKERDYFRLGVTPSEPWYHKDPKTGKWSGLAVSLAQAIADAMGVELKFVEVTWGTAVAALQANQIDTMFVLDPTPERAMAIDFAGPMFFYPLGAIVREDMEVGTWSDLNKKDVNVAVTLGTSNDLLATPRLPNANISRYPSNDETVASFQAGRAAAIIMNTVALTMYQRKVGGGKVVILSPVAFFEPSAGVRREANDTWKEYLDTVLRYLYATGRTQQFYNDYLKTLGIDPATVPPIMKEQWFEPKAKR